MAEKEYGEDSVPIIVGGKHEMQYTNVTREQYATPKSKTLISLPLHLLIFQSMAISKGFILRIKHK